jgi:S-DNA-T family DNA segregation ATPase FtsK/SpoIIIE
MTAAKKKTPTKGGNKKGKTASKKKNQSRRLTNNGIMAILLLCAALFLVLFIAVSPGIRVTGLVLGLQYLVKLFVVLFGIGRFIFPFFLLLLAYAFYKKESADFGFAKHICFSSLLYIVVLAFLCIDQEFIAFNGFIQVAAGGSGGGVIGGFFAFCLLLLMNKVLSIFFLILFGLICIFVIGNFSPSLFMENMRDRRQQRKEEKVLEKEELRKKAEEKKEEEDAFDFSENLDKNSSKKWFSKEKTETNGVKKKKVVEYSGNDKVIIDGMVFTKDMPSDDYTPVSFREHLTGVSDVEDIAPSYNDSESDPDMGLVAGLHGGAGAENISEKIFSVDRIDERVYNEDVQKEAAVFEEVVPKTKQPSRKEGDGADISADENKTELMPHFSPPKTSILTKGEKSSQKKVAQNIKSGISKLEKTLESFGVQARVTEVSCGPAITRYEVQPGPGVKVSKIVNLADDIALQLAAADIRMEAPVPGKSVIGIEVPRKDTVTVYFREILESSRFFDLPSKLTCAFGKDITGNPIIGDLATMPHLLIAGTTGSGKSVCMNTMICSILFKATPDQVKFIMIDPKQVEFVIYEGLPHLITPVVTDPKKAAGALKWALREMENRYTLFNQNRVRNIEGYNALVEDVNEKMPQIVIFIDELADLMMVAAKDVEASICRLAQKARAAGIHLVVATQRPSVDVITGLIKANIPSRIALSVSSQTDSRTILDMGGAEKLLGKGDMLYLPIGYSKPVRVQGAWLSDQDAVAILDHYKHQGEPDYIEGVAQAVETGMKKEADYGDELFFDAARAAIAAGQASTSMMQRRFRIGYNHAARIMEELQEKGVVGPADGARPRTVLMSLEVFESTFKEPQEQSLFEE